MGLLFPKTEFKLKTSEQVLIWVWYNVTYFDKVEKKYIYDYEPDS